MKIREIKGMWDDVDWDMVYFSTMPAKIRLPKQLTDDDIKLLIKNTEFFYMSDLAKELRLVNKLPDWAIELMIKKCCHNDCRRINQEIQRLVQEIPDDYKPTDDIIKLLNRKGYEVLD